MMMSMPNIMNMRISMTLRGRSGMVTRAPSGTLLISSTPKFWSLLAMTPRAMVMPPRIIARPRNLK